MAWIFGSSEMCNFRSRSFIWVFITFVFLHVGVVHGEDLSQELVLTGREMEALSKLKIMIEKAASNSTMDFVKQDLFLLRFLRAKNLDLKRTENDIYELLDFWNKNKIDNFLQQDWSDLFAEQPFNIDAIDRLGRPVAYVTIGDGWDIRGIVLQGKRKRLMLYIYNIVIKIGEQLIEMNKQQGNITQFDFVLNMDGYNLVQHACIACISTYTDLLVLYEKLLPGFASEIAIINAPRRRVVYPIIRQFLSKSTNKVLKIFDNNKTQWKEYLDAIIDPAQLPWNFGGTKKEQ